MPAAGSGAFDRRLDPRSAAPLAVAFSGGSDSLALLVLAKAWADGVGRRVVALTVDHGLSPASRDWTVAASATAARLQAEWRGLSWTGAKPSSGLPAAARHARHRLLAQTARELGARVVLLGHTADDRRESDLIRRETPSLGDLREWSPSPAWPQGRGVFLLRPLLQARRAELQAWLLGLGLDWLDDPANADPRFARSRARAHLARCDPGNCDLDLCDLNGAPTSPQAGGAPAAPPAVVPTPDGRLKMARSSFGAAPDTMLRKVVGAALLCASGTSVPARSQRLDALIAQARGASSFKATLCGARIMAAADEVVFAREAGELRRAGAANTSRDDGSVRQPHLPASPGRDGRGEDGGSDALRVDGVLDGRFEVDCDPAYKVTALAGCAARLGRDDAREVRSLPAYARGVLPALVDAAGQVSLPAPFGGGAGQARSLVARRMAAACGLIAAENDLDTERLGRPGARPTMFFESILG